MTNSIFDLRVLAILLKEYPKATVSDAAILIPIIRNRLDLQRVTC